MPYQAICSDISYVRTNEGFLYLCVVKDIVTGDILGHATAARMKKELVIKAFLNAHARHPFGKDIIANLLKNGLVSSPKSCGFKHVSGEDRSRFLS